MNAPAHTRRHFLGLVSSAALTAPAALQAVEPFVHRGPARLRLSLAAYSFRQFFRDQPGRAERPAGDRTLDMAGFIDFCAANGCEGTELTSYYFPPDPSPEFLLGLRRHAFLRGISISGTAVGNTFTHPPGERRDREIALVRTWIERARVLGAPHIRVFAGNQGDQSLADARRHCIAALEECAEAAGRAGVFLGIENHGGIVSTADDLLEIIRSVRSPWVGVNLDTGNFHSADPYAEVARCAPYAVNVQVKVEVRRQGREAEPADLARVVRLLRETNYQGWVALEYEASEDPFVAVPRSLGELKGLLAASA